MGLFSRKKPALPPQQNLAGLPEFPTFPGGEKSAPVEVREQKVASYEPAIRPEDIARIQQSMRASLPAAAPQPMQAPPAPPRMEALRAQPIGELSQQRPAPVYPPSPPQTEPARMPARQQLYESDVGLRPVPQMMSAQGRYEALTQSPPLSQPMPQLSERPVQRFEQQAYPAEGMRRQYAGREELLPGERPVFVKLDQYREVMGRVSELKEQLREAEVVLTRLDTLRKQEDQEMRYYKEHLQALKERLLEIDKRLFEV